MGEITASEIPRMKVTQTSGWEVAAGISDSVEEIEIDEYTSNIDFEALQDLEDYVQQKCVNQRDTVSFDKLKETDEFQKLLAECGLEGVQFDNYSDFLSKTSEIKIDAINSSTGINKEDYTPSGNTEQYLNDVESLTDDLEKQIDYYSDVNNILEKNMDSSIDEVDPTDDINSFLSYLSTGSREADKEFYISQINSRNSTNSNLLSIISGLFPEYEINQDYTLGEGLTFHFDESGNLVVTDYDYDKLSAYLKSIQNEFKDENKYTSEVVAQFVNDANFDATQSIYMQNTQIKNLLEEQKIKTVTDMYMYSIDTETGEMNFNQDYANYFNQDRFKKNHQESYSVYEIYQSMLDQSATLPGFDESFYELANYMDQDQLSVFIYLYGTQGSDAALDYVNLFKNKKTEYEAMREISNELETMINWPDEINEYSDMIYEVSNYISENYDNVTMDWDEFKNREEFQEYIKQLAYYKYTYENPENELDFDEWQESNQEYINNFVDGVTAFDNSEELISSLLTAETEMTYSYINEIINDPTQVKLKENIETLVLARLGGFGEGLMSGLSLTSNEREQLTQQYTASILSQSMMLNIAYQVGNQEGSMLPSMYLGMIGGYYGGELATQTLGIFNGADSKAIDFINSALNKTVKTVELADGTTQTISLGQSLISNSGRAIYGLDMFTNSFYGSKINGSTTGEAIGRAFFDSLIQVGAQAFIGSIPGLSRSGEYLAQDKLDAVRAWLCKSLQEGAANAATIYVTQGINSVLYGDEFDLDSITEEAYTQFIVGAIVGAETNVGQLANYKEKTIKITLNGLSYEVPIEDLYSLIEKNGNIKKEDMVKLVQGLSTSTISISAQAQELKEKYKLTDEEAVDVAEKIEKIMAKENASKEVATIMVTKNVSKEVATKSLQIIADYNNNIDDSITNSIKNVINTSGIKDLDLESIAIYYAQASSSDSHFSIKSTESYVTQIIKDASQDWYKCNMFTNNYEKLIEYVTTNYPEQAKVLKQIHEADPYLKSKTNSKKIAKSLALIQDGSFYSSSINLDIETATLTLREIQKEAQLGHYEVSVDEVLNYKIQGYNTSKENKQQFINSLKKPIIGNDETNYTEYFPTQYVYQSDKGTVDYTLSLLSEETKLDIAKSYNIDIENINSITIDQLGTYLKNYKARTENFVPIEVVTFQNAADGANNYVKYDGALGGTQAGSDIAGAFSFPASYLKELSQKYPSIFSYNQNTKEIKIYDMKKFGQEVLGGVPLSSDGVYICKQIVTLNGETSGPSVVNGSSYLVNNIPGGFLPSGIPEIVVPGVKIDGYNGPGNYTGTYAGSGGYSSSYTIELSK